MKRFIAPAAAALIILTACASIMGKWGESKLGKLSEKCLAENDALKPSTARWQNLSTQERTKKKREMEQYKKKRIDLYQAIHTFKNVYASSIGRDGKCRVKECSSLEKIRLQIIEGCPGAGEAFPRTAAE